MPVELQRIACDVEQLATHSSFSVSLAERQMALRACMEEDKAHCKTHNNTAEFLSQKFGGVFVFEGASSVLACVVGATKG